MELGEEAAAIHSSPCCERLSSEGATVASLDLDGADHRVDVRNEAGTRSSLSDMMGMA